RYLLHHERDLARALLRLDAAENRLALSQPQSPLLQEGTRSLGMAIALSVAVLSPAARQLLDALAWLPPRPASLARAAALALAGAEAPLTELLDAGLAEPLGTERLTVHQTIADYCRSLPTSADVVANVVTYFASFAEDHAADDRQLALELENITAALQLAGLHNRPVDLARGAVALAPFSTRRGELVMAQQLLAAAAAQLTEQVPASLQARLFLALGDNAARRGDLPAGVAAAEQAQALDQSGDAAAEIAKLLGTLHYRLGGLALAERYLDVAVEAFAAVGDETGRNSARSLQALCQLQQGNHAAAAATFAALIEASAALGDRYLEVRAWHNLGFTHLLRQELPAAADAYNRCVALARQYGDHQAVGAALADLGALTGQQGDLLGAQAHYQQALQIAREQGDQLVMAMTLSNLGNVTLDLGLFEEADNYLEQALAISQANGILRTQGSVKIHQARLALLAGNLDQALATAQQALQIARDVADISYEVEALILLGRAALAGEMADATAHFTAARTLAQQYDLPALAAEALAGEAAADQACKHDQATHLTSQAN
ncbi:MAG: tetratricopeptide repeat protein, partial [Anaerolineales bacterium]|nr:tetratricopeptide repeat protein [Anaerolineales bacterium]